MKRGEIIVAISEEEFEAANERGRETLAKGPLAVSAYYDAVGDRICIMLNTGYGIIFAPSQAQELERAKPNDLSEIEIDAPGLSVYFPKIEAGLYLPSLMEGIWGTKRWTAQRMGVAGGASKSETKAKAARNNGSCGGRPPKPKRHYVKQAPPSYEIR